MSLDHHQRDAPTLALSQRRQGTAEVAWVQMANATSDESIQPRTGDADKHANGTESGTDEDGQDFDVDRSLIVQEHRGLDFRTLLQLIVGGVGLVLGVGAVLSDSYAAFHLVLAAIIVAVVILIVLIRRLSGDWH